MSIETKALEQLLKEFQKLRERFIGKAEKERAKVNEVCITVKGEKIHTDEELFELYEGDVITSKQHDAYRDKLEAKRKRAGEDNNKTKSEVVVKILTNYICDLQYEIADEKREENVKKC